MNFHCLRKSILLVYLIFQSSLVSAKVNIPVPVEHKLSNGLKILFLYSDKLPTFSISALIPSASALQDPPGKSGLAALTANLLDKGTRSMSRTEIQGQLDFIGAELSASASYGHTVSSVVGLTRNWKQLAHLFVETVRYPAFPNDEFNRVKKLKKDIIMTVPDSPSSVLSRAFYQELFRGTPLFNPSSGRLSDMENITVQDVKGFHNSRYGARDTVIIVSGKFRESEVLSFLRKGLEDWSGMNKTSETEIGSFFENPVKPRTVFVHKKDLSQVWITQGRFGVPRKNALFYSMQLANQILGGSFTSRLNQRIRDDLGLTYSISSSFSFGAHMGYFQLSTFVESGKLHEMLNETAQVLDEVKIKNPFKVNELQGAQKYLTGVFPISIQSVDDLAGLYLKGEYLGMEPEFVRRYIPSIKAVKLNEVQDVSSIYFNSKEMLRVLVGDKRKIGKRPKDWEYTEIKDYL